MNIESVLAYCDSLEIPGTGVYRYSREGGPSLYGTCFVAMTRRYLGRDRCKHSRMHVIHHLAAHALPVIQDNGIELKWPLAAARQFCDLSELDAWLDGRDMSDAWLEGNNLLFIGQFLLYLRDVETFPGAAIALERWFQWLDDNVDPKTGLWGSDGKCSPFIAMCGGYHQLLAYYYENRPLNTPDKLVDTVLSLQHIDGGLSPTGGGGACEDVDAIDILVNLYKLYDYRRPDIRYAVRRCLKQVLAQQNPDGGFPYCRDRSFNHLNVPSTFVSPNVSHAFGTWFRVHTVALIAQVLGDELPTELQTLRFNSAFSMGWHRQWIPSDHPPRRWSPILEAGYGVRIAASQAGQRANGLKHKATEKARKLAGRLLTKLGLR